MRKLLSLILAWSLVLALCLPVSAATTGKLVTVTKDNFAAYQTDDEVVMMAWDDLGTVALSAKYLNDPETIYQWIGTAEEIPASLTGQKLAAAFSVADVARLQATEVFEVEMQNAEMTRVGGNAVIMSMIEEDMIDLCGTPMTRWPVSVDRSTYAPLVVKVLETDTVDAAYTYNVELEIGMTILSAANTLASASLTVRSAVEIINEIVGVEDMTYTLMEGGFVEVYVGTYVTQRTGVVQPEQGNEVPTHSATKSYRRIFCWAEIDGAEGYVPNADYDIIYFPDEYSYQTSVMIEEAYEIYSA